MEITLGCGSEVLGSICRPCHLGKLLPCVKAGCWPWSPKVIFTLVEYECRSLTRSPETDRFLNLCNSKQLKRPSKFWELSGRLLQFLYNTHKNLCHLYITSLIATSPKSSGHLFLFKQVDLLVFITPGNKCSRAENRNAYKTSLFMFKKLKPLGEERICQYRQNILSKNIRKRTAEYRK